MRKLTSYDIGRAMSIRNTVETLI